MVSEPSTSSVTVFPESVLTKIWYHRRNDLQQQQLQCWDRIVSSFNRMNYTGWSFLIDVFFSLNKKKKTEKIEVWECWSVECQSHPARNGRNGWLPVCGTSDQNGHVRLWLAVRRVRIGTARLLHGGREALTIAFLMAVIMETNASLSLSG